MAKTPKPKTVRPSDIAETEPQGDESPEKLYRAVGVALTGWEMLDDHLAWLFGALVNSRNGAAYTAYGCIQSPAGRHDMVISATDSVIPSDNPLNNDIKTLVSDIGKLAGRRNDIAHGVVTSFSQIKGERTTKHGHYLVPANYNTRKRAPRETSRYDDPAYKMYKYAYTAAQVLQYANHFALCSQRVTDALTRAHDYLEPEGPAKVARQKARAWMEAQASRPKRQK